MTLFEFLDISYRLNVSNENTPAKDGTANAIHTIVSLQRTYLKYTAVVRLMVGFTMVKMGFKSPPALVVPTVPEMMAEIAVADAVMAEAPPEASTDALPEVKV